MITVTVNGRSREFDGEMSLPELVSRLEITFPRIAVAHNGEVLRQEEHAQAVIRDGDTIEIVRMVGGGT
ncbi:MAG: sulfur carrier protein ThiS [Dehalococcoidia bacterium]